eukprot:gene17039-biopygen8299
MAPHNIPGIPWKSHGIPWDFHGIPWYSMECPLHLHAIPWSSMELSWNFHGHGVPWNSWKVHVIPWDHRTVARAWRGHGAGYRHFFGLGGAGVARAWRGRGAGMSCDPWDSMEFYGFHALPVDFHGHLWNPCGIPWNSTVLKKDDVAKKSPWLSSPPPVLPGAPGTPRQPSSFTARKRKIVNFANFHELSREWRSSQRRGKVF